MALRVYIYETADYGVYLDHKTDVGLPEERRLCYFVEHKKHRVLFDTTSQLGGAVVASQGLQAFIDEITARELQPAAAANGKAN